MATQTRLRSKSRPNSGLFGSGKEHVPEGLPKCLSDHASAHPFSPTPPTVPSRCLLTKFIIQQGISRVMSTSECHFRLEPQTKLWYTFGKGPLGELGVSGKKRTAGRAI